MNTHAGGTTSLLFPPPEVQLKPSYYHHYILSAIKIILTQKKPHILGALHLPFPPSSILRQQSLPHL